MFFQRHVPAELHEQLSEELIQGLDNDIVRRVIEGIKRKGKKSFCDVISTTEGVAGTTVEEMKIKKSQKK